MKCDPIRICFPHKATRKSLQTSLNVSSPIVLPLLTVVSIFDRIFDHAPPSIINLLSFLLMRGCQIVIALDTVVTRDVMIPNFLDPIPDPDPMLESAPLVEPIPIR